MSDSQAPAAPAATPTPAASAAPTEIPKETKPTDATAPNEAVKAADDSEDIDDALDESEEKALSAKDEKEAKRLWKLKVQGKDLDVDEEELVKRAQMGYSADQKWQEAAQIKRQVEGFLGLLQQDPVEALSKIGINVDDLAEKHIQRRIEEMQKTPEQLEREKLEKEVRRLQKAAEDRETQEKQLEQQRMQEKFAVEFENDIMSALDDPKSGLPKSPYFIKRIADTMIFAMKNGVKNIKAADAITMIKDEARRELQDMYAQSPDELFEELIGKDRLTKYRKGKVKKSRPVPTADVKATGQSELKSQSPKQEDKPRMKQRDFFKNLGSK